ncbi:ATP-dependent DNA helicase RecG [Ferrimicrobium acidiphilum]|uniref:ATP-dependent DNA helicase RecG n=1 Tax=Ferrimicrobium acidiphilum TaxID=121039 RepID=UPI0023F03B51|nr:ATP-dependent DNA helicase RecG [Ferrimicrobium acidiphilum]
MHIAVATAVRLDELTRLSVEELSGIGPARARALNALGVETIYDLVTYFPRRYIDRSRQVSIGEAVPGEQVLLVGRVVDARRIPTRGGRVIVEAQLVDASGKITLTFFGQPYRAKQLASIAGEVAVFGRVELFRRRRQMTNPLVDPIGDKTGAIVPLYSLREAAGLNSSDIARAVAQVFSTYSDFVDVLPPSLRDHLGMYDVYQALWQLHFPSNEQARQIARRRVAFDELFLLQVKLAQLRAEREALAVATVHDTHPFGAGEARLVEDFLSRLPFAPTTGQLTAVGEIAADMASEKAMHRLLQGDVGSGKTLVSVLAMLFAVQSGHQAVLVAPTEVLADQHFRSISALLAETKTPDSSTGRLFEGLPRPVTIDILTGSTPAARRRKLLAELADGYLDIVVGTHALFNDELSFASLGLVVVDEQHRFGVEQRSALTDRVTLQQGSSPDTLVMTATPIPRTAAMTVYGDLDVSVIEGLPPGRRSIETRWARTPAEATAAFELLRQQVGQGRQGYVVCPVVEESAKLQVRAVTDEYERLNNAELAGLRLGLVHGKMNSKAKEEVMAAFRSREIDVLVATTVIEVGVDVANATVMIIEDADRFGIAQLHQLRGRVGRGAEQSYCYLLSEAETAVAEARLGALVATEDGFALAEVDLELRGEGTVLGGRQAGRTDLKMASLSRDRELVLEARQHARAIIALDRSLAKHPRLRAMILALFGEDEADFLLRS